MLNAVNFRVPSVAAMGRWCWPARCLVCSHPEQVEHDLCDACCGGLPWHGPACPVCALPQADAATPCARCTRDGSPLAHSHAAFRYAFPLDRLLPRLKFHNMLAATRVLTPLLACRFADLDRPQLLIPIPLHRTRLRSRGYDQALELARPLARHLRIPLGTGLLQRQRITQAQSRLDAAQRRANLHDAFRVRAGSRLPSHVALFDDVMTTGATLQAAAQALRDAGVPHVDAWVCARVPEPE